MTEHELRQKTAEELRNVAMKILDHRNPLEDFVFMNSAPNYNLGSVDIAEGRTAGGVFIPLDNYNWCERRARDHRLSIVVTVADSCDITAEGEL